MELLQPVPDQAASRVAAQFHDGWGVADFLGGKRLVSFTIEEQTAAMNAGFVSKNRSAHHRLVRVQGPARSARD